MNFELSFEGCQNPGSQWVKHPHSFFYEGEPVFNLHYSLWTGVLAGLSFCGPNLGRVSQAATAPEHVPNTAKSHGITDHQQDGALPVMNGVMGPYKWPYKWV